MPTYEFRCPNGHEFTHFYKTMSTALSKLPCTKCSAVAERQMSASAGLVFKGSGFYLTDYGKNAHRGTEGGAKKDGAEKREERGEKREEGGEKKPEAKPTADSTVTADSSTAKTEKPAKSEAKTGSGDSASKAESSKSKSKSETSKPKSA